MTQPTALAPAAAAALLACATLAAAPAAAQTTIRASTWHPPAHPGVVGGFERFMDHVKQASGGDLDFQFWSGGSLLGARDTLPGVENGIVDVGVLALTYFPAEFPHFQLIADMAMLSDKPPAIAAAVAELMMLDCAPCRADFEDKGLVFTSTYSTTPYTLISKQRLASPEDLKGKSYRSAGALWDRWVESVGGTSVNVSAAEMFESLDRGGVDVAVFSPAALKAYSLWDVASYDVMLPLGVYAAMSLFTFNQGFWSDLDDDQRKVVLEGAAFGTMGVTYAYMRNDEEALAAAAEHGVEIVEPTPELTSQLAAFVESDLESLARIARDRHGVADPEPIIARYRELLEKWEAIYEETGGDQDAMTAALQREVYDKVDLASYGQ
ncbi:C4-dicarboxylate TRAP transporter substrate-binding protein [uncultured Albimonas sp.]|uniref:C4-dicarboxylate TRAP transporter substrate-binding protein n=1 Tax=uncultured Albimonas sp. TaxID=1331701 RepID=UPI0030EB445D|tara:strand:- start:2277 stop:3419 length:1143 start_codon:yes stop_codon:yes gene_type:complete